MYTEGTLSSSNLQALGTKRWTKEPKFLLSYKSLLLHEYAMQYQKVTVGAVTTFKKSTTQVLEKSCEMRTVKMWQE